MTTTEKNILIADFLEIQKLRQLYCPICPTTGVTLFLEKENLNFHLDWNWLMEAVEKIEILGFYFEIKRNWVKITKNKKVILVRWEDDRKKIGAVFNACVDFVIWYNDNKGYL